MTESSQRTVESVLMLVGVIAAVLALLMMVLVISHEHEVVGKAKAQACQSAAPERIDKCLHG